MTTAEAKQYPQGLPWPVVGLVLTAMGAHYTTANKFIGLPIAAALFIVGWISSWKLPRSRTISWGVRIAIAVVLISQINSQGDRDTTPWYLNQQDTNLVGYALAAELVLRAWERRDPANPREWTATGMLIGSLLFLMATDVYVVTAIEWLTPVFCLFVVLTLRWLVTMRRPGDEPLKRRSALLSLRAAVFIFAIGGSFTAVYLVTHYEYTLTRWAVNTFKRDKPNSSEIGFSTSPPRLSNVFNPMPSPDRVLIIHGRTTDGHLRVLSFDTYAGQTWTPALGDRRFYGVAIRSPSPPGASPMHIERVGDTADLLPVPLVAASVSAEEPLEEDDYGTVRDTMSGAGLSYDVVSAASPMYQGPLAGALDEQTRAKLLAVPPEVDPKVAELARQVAGEGEPARKLFRIQQELRAHHKYSLAYQPQGEPLSDFVLNNGAAHCQYFASAMVIMSRAAGIPARYVTGFFAHEPYGTDQMVVRQRDAHAWAECYIDGTGWVTIDATPATGMPNAVYDDPSWWEKWKEKLSDIPTRVRLWLTKHTYLLQRILIFGAPIAIVLWIIRRLIARRKAPPATSNGYLLHDEELLALSRRFDDWLRRREMSCPPQTTWRERLDAVPEPRAQRFVELYENARFGVRDESSIREAGAVMNEIESSNAEYKERSRA